MKITEIDLATLEDLSLMINSLPEKYRKLPICKLRMENMTIESLDRLKNSIIMSRKPSLALITLKDS